MVRCDGLTNMPVLYRRENAVKEFLRRLQGEMGNIIRRNMSATECQSSRGASDCQICGRALQTHKVRDHCHISGKYRGAAYSDCKLKHRMLPKKLVFHNLRCNDGHLIMQAIFSCEATQNEESEFSCMPKNMAKYMTSL